MGDELVKTDDGDDAVRATERDRESIVARLRDFYVAGALTQPELERRIEAALTAESVPQLRALVSGLRKAQSSAIEAKRRTPLTLIEVDPTHVVVRMGRLARRYTWRRRLTLPLDSVSGVSVERHGQAAVRGTRLVGRRNERIVAGVFDHVGLRTLAAARPFSDALVLELRGGKYVRAVLEVDDPHGAAARIRAWMEP